MNELSKKITWEKIYKDLKQHRAAFAKKVIYWRPYDYATILLYLDDGKKAIYNYDYKGIKFTG